MRRTLQRISAAGAVAVVLGGGYALLGAQQPGRSTAALTSTAAAGAACRTTRGKPVQGTAPGAAGAASRIRLGPGMELAPSPRAIAAARRGRRLLVSGTVRAADCLTPLQGATVHAWQTNADGEYGPGHGSSQLRCCYLQGTARTDAAGRYELETVMPGHYKGEDPSPPAHIHFDVRHPGARGLMTELDFQGDPSLDPSETAVEVVPITRIAGSHPPTLGARFDIVLRGS
jgi:protocatechuate 3,4-dioxygenase beta subunit